MSQTSDEIDRALLPSTPRWVKVFGAIALILILLAGIILISGGEHGPGRHLPITSVTQDFTPSTEHGGQHP